MLTGCSGTSDVRHASIDLRQLTLTELQSLRDISQFSIREWTPINSQALIADGGLQRSYLFILMFAEPDIVYSDSLGISSNQGRIKTGWSKVEARNGFSKRGVTIDRIYLLRNDDERQYAIDMINAHSQQERPKAPSDQVNSNTNKGMPDHFRPHRRPD